MMRLFLPARAVSCQCLVLLVVVIVALPAHGQAPLFIPETVSGSTINLALQEGTHEFFPGHVTQTMGANGGILGPTILLEKGQDVTLNVHNQLPELTTIHWHGLHVAPENDGGPHTTIDPGATWSPSFTVLDEASTYWYHPHAHHMTEQHVTMGIAGLIIVQDDDEAALDLPRTYGVDDIPVIIQTKHFDADKQIVTYSHTDDVPMVNGTIDPYVTLPAQVVRLRLLNGSSMRVFNVGFSGNRVFHQIGSDGGLLENSVAQTRLRLSPGERAEILIDLAGLEGTTLHLRSFASELPNGIYGATFPGMGQGMTLNGYNPNPLNGANFDLLRIDVEAPTPEPVTSIVTDLVEVSPWNAAEADTLRTFTFNPTVGGPNQLNHPFTINNAPFNMNVINEVIPLDNLEIWEITNSTAIGHPFHVHMVQFYVLTRNGALPPVHERGRKDVVFVNPMETVRIIAKFETFANPDVPYMYHCHMLIHEDEDMMGQFIVVDMTTSTENLPQEQPGLYPVTVAPNPFTSSTSIAFELPADDQVTVSVYTLHGQLVRTLTDDHLPRGRHDVTFDATGLASGVYVVEVVTSSQRASRTMMVIK